MDWATLNPIVLDIISEIAIDVPIPGAAAFRGQWAGRSREMASPEYGHSLYLEVTTITGVGNDEERYEVDDTDPDNPIETNTSCGIRKINLQVRSECTENTDDNWCFAVLDRIYTRLWRQRYIDRLRDDGNAAFISSRVARIVPVAADGRVISCGVLDLVLYAGFNDIDTGPNVGWIERVLLSSTVPPDADPTPDELIPPA